MSLTVEVLTRQHEYKRASRKLDSLMTEHPGIRTLTPKVLAKQIYGVSPTELAAILSLLECAGHLRLVYKVIAIKQPGCCWLRRTYNKRRATSPNVYGGSSTPHLANAPLFRIHLQHGFQDVLDFLPAFPGHEAVFLFD